MEIIEIKNYLRNREEKEKKTINKKRENILNQLNNLIYELIKKYTSIKKVIIYGSILEDYFTLYSDLDIFIDNISAKEFWEINKFLNNNMDIEVDLYTQDDDVPLLNMIKENGKVIYERKD